MGEKVTIVAVSDDDVVLGQIDRQGVIFSDRRGAIVGHSAHQLRRLLGNGFGRVRFHMELEELRLEDCRVVSPHMVFTYRAEVAARDTDVEELAFEDTWRD